MAVTREEKAAAYAIQALRKISKRIDTALEGQDLFSRNDFQENLNSLGAEVDDLISRYEFLAVEDPS